MSKGILLCCPKIHLEKLYAPLPPLWGDNISAKGLAPNIPHFQSCQSPKDPRFRHLRTPKQLCYGQSHRLFFNFPITSWPFSLPNQWASNPVHEAGWEAGTKPPSPLSALSFGSPYLLGGLLLTFSRTPVPRQVLEQSSHASERKPLLSLCL